MLLTFHKHTNNTYFTMAPTVPAYCHTNMLLSIFHCTVFWYLQDLQTQRASTSSVAHHQLLVPSHHLQVIGHRQSHPNDMEFTIWPSILLRGVQHRIIWTTAKNCKLVCIQCVRDFGDNALYKSTIYITWLWQMGRCQLNELYHWI